MISKIKTGDTVQIISGKDRVKKTKDGSKTSKGNQGKVIQVLPELDMVVVEGINTRYKHVRARRAGETGQRIEYAAPLHISNVMLVCPKCKKNTRVGSKLLATDQKGSKKMRMCKRCKEAIDA
jgi:large subunit ribosomal protein L24